MGVAIGYPLPLLLRTERDREMQFYSEEECLVALTKARVEIERRAKFAGEYKRGFNDCAAFLAVYDNYLRDESRAHDKLVFEWNSVKEFVQKLYLRGHTVKSYLEYCGYHIVKNQGPILGDVAYDNGGMIYDGYFWVSTNEDNSGIERKKIGVKDPRVLIARPIRS